MKPLLAGLASAVIEAVENFFKKWRLYFVALITLLFLQVPFYVVFNHFFGTLWPHEAVIGALIFLFIVTFWFFCSCITPDGKEVKMRWW